MNSFTVSYVWDGSCIMTGDLGFLIWQRTYYHGQEYCFPYPNTNIEYFAEKVKCGVIEEWDAEIAVKEFINYVNELDEPDDETDRLCYDVETGRITWDSQEDMIDTIEELDDFDLEFTPGMKWTWRFKYQFELLKQVSPLIAAEIQKKF